MIYRTEAMVVVDVNTGKFTGKGGNKFQKVTAQIANAFLVPESTMARSLPALGFGDDAVSREKCANRKPCAFQVVAHQPSNIGIVFDDKDRLFHEHIVANRPENPSSPKGGFIKH